MQRHGARLCALVRFVHARSGVRDTGGPLRVDTLNDFAAAVRTSRPALVRLDLLGLNEACSLSARGGEDLLPQMRALCGHRDVVVRLPTPTPHSQRGQSHAHDTSSTQSSTSSFTFGDARLRSPYKHVVRRRLDSIVDDMISCKGTGNRIECYAANIPIEAKLPELSRAIRPLKDFIASTLSCHFGPVIPGTPSLYFGSGLQRTPLHFDPTENLTVVLQGSKQFRLFPPSASSHLSPKGGMLAAAVCWWAGVVPAVYSEVDAWDHSGLNCWNTSGAQASDVIINSGEVLYLPPGWWHAVSGSEEPNVTIVFGYAPCVSKGARYFRRWLPRLRL